MRLTTNGTISGITISATTTLTEDDIGNNAGTTAATTDGADGDATTSVSIVPGASSLTDTAFQPNPIQVTVGNTVTSSESGDPDDEFDSHIMAPGATFEHT